MRSSKVLCLLSALATALLVLSASVPDNSPGSENVPMGTIRRADAFRFDLHCSKIKSGG